MHCYDPREGEEFKGVEKNTDAPVATETTICNSVVCDFESKKKIQNALSFGVWSFFFVRFCWSRNPSGLMWEEINISLWREILCVPYILNQGYALGESSVI